MGLKKYIFSGLLLSIAIFVYVFSLESGDYRVQILDYSLVLPVALWVVLPTLFLFVMSILHMLFYGLKKYFALKAVSKDSESMVSLIDKKLLNEKSKVNFQNKDLKAISNILNQLDIDISDSNFSSENKEITKVVDQIFQIRSGKYVSAKDLKLSDSNPLMIENLKNRIEMDENFALEAVKKSANYSSTVVKKAFFKVLETKSMTTIKKLLNEIEFDEEMVLGLLKKDSEKHNEFSLLNDDILNLIKKVTFTNAQLIQVIKNYKSAHSPDQMINLFEDISTYNDEYTTAYLYALAEYEMIDKIRDIISNSGTNEFIPFRALVDLKDAGKHSYSIDTLILK
jgi:hypothetical protein